ncbi:pyridoxal kinase PdxY [Propioniciclava sinopodophylli]|uniref:pyridoxal kinase n=1 Tax=Propioniciclava sinopodophylli TaxID=1837344 RepID=A0A4Q9KFQ3_9ACTN|nr:pyridoxal kinase PdxY [Propioniciclava sinopodophylli]TBT85393.1 pyridoxal kinase PdxY [Propioniciclava sinopodophylli]
MTTILSIQSSVAYGHVGNSAATFPLMRVGCEVWPVLTVHFSNNTSYPSKKGPLLRPEDVHDVVEGIDELGVLPRVDAVLTGYQGAPAMGAEILKVVELVKERNPQAVYCCDPVMGDVGRGMYVLPGIPEFVRDNVIAAADILTPNHYELNFLTGREAATLDEVIEAAHALREVGPDVVLVTSVVTEEAAPDTVTMVAVNSEGAWSVTTPLLGRNFTGSGDLTSSMFLAALLESGSVADAVGRTADIVYSVLERTTMLDQRELALVAAQDDLVAPRHHFEVARVR